MRTIKAIALRYDAVEDRLLAVVNPGAVDSWSYWLTRQLVLGMLGRLPAALEASSAVAGSAPVEYRHDVASFEREAALASTEPAMSQTPDSIMQLNASSADLAVTIAFEGKGNGFRIFVTGQRGEQAAGLFGRADLQRILHMLEVEVAKARWRSPGVDVQVAPVPAGSAGGKRRMN